MAAKIRPSWILGAGAIAAAAAILPGGSAPASGGGAVAPVANEISGAPLAGPTATPAPTAGAQTLARIASAAPVASPAELAEPAPAPVATGEAALAGQVDLSKMELVGDHYEVALPDGR
ncbi:MAG: hypothetical protein K8W52_34845, partial [Deltaproteobacteria bacterium]|nr:hypothetical protein [Deltaproteobacteria bacterium]